MLNLEIREMFLVMCSKFVAVKMQAAMQTSDVMDFFFNFLLISLQNKPCTFGAHAMK